MNLIEKVYLKKCAKFNSLKHDLYGFVPFIPNRKGIWLEAFYQELGWYNQRLVSVFLRQSDRSLSFYDPKKLINKKIRTESPSFIGFRYKVQK